MPGVVDCLMNMMKNEDEMQFWMEMESLLGSMEQESLIKWLDKGSYVKVQWLKLTTKNYRGIYLCSREVKRITWSFIVEEQGRLKRNVM